EEIIRSYPEHERETRAFGIPAAGEGKVFTIAESEIREDPVRIPDYWRQIIGIDVGIGHPFAAVHLAHDPDSDTVHVVNCYRTKGLTPPVHASTCKRWGEWIPVAWPHDGGHRDKGSGTQLIELYRQENVNVLPRSARYDIKKGGPQPVNPIVETAYERMTTGRFKVFSPLTDWFSEFRMLHRKDGVIQPRNDDLMKATFYALMSLNYAMPASRRTQRIRRHTPVQGLRQWG
ncbi:MAG: DNA packaging protein, partial [Geminicoccaceae bacterium]